MADEPPAKINKPNKLSNKKEEKRRCKESKLIQQLEKQKRKEENKQQVQQEEKESKGRLYTLSVALPGSLLNNAQSPELRTYLAGQIAWACAVFCVDEVVIFDELGEDAKNKLILILDGLLNPLDSPHHMRINEEAEFREGVLLDQPSKPGKGSFVNCGMRKDVQIDKQLKSGLRVTVQLNKSPNKGTHTLYMHMLVVFGGLQGLEASVDADENLNVADPGVLFDLYLNTCPGQGSRTIRTEEAILISLSGLRQKISAVFPDKPKG
uniref:28S rRNA (uridine-N(3))-methyltransferase n=1 Tax=Cyprinus carpio TaxID=7962 RepID=A0A8C1PDJ8_CYPCA